MKGPPTHPTMIKQNTKQE